jgi:hypothetical protein
LLRSRNPLYERDLALRTRSFWMFGGISHIEGELLTLAESEKPYLTRTFAALDDV